MSVFVFIQKILLCVSGQRIEVSLSGKENSYILKLSSYVFQTSSKIIKHFRKVR